MIVSLTPLMWSLVQVSLLASVSIFIASLLRGRYPQWTSAMLAGSGVASLVLVAVAWVPAWQWSLASHAVDQSLQSLDASSPSDANFDSPASSDSSSNAEASTKVASTLSNAVETNETNTRSSKTIQHWMSLAASWASNQLQQVDNRVRSFEATASEARSKFAIAQAVVGLLIIFLGGFWVYCWIWTRALVRHGQPTSDTKLLERTQQHALRMKLKNTPRVLLSSKVTIGATVGYRRKTILLSSNWNQWSDAELDAVLLHELAHVVRNDYAWVLLSSWIRTLFFFHPLMHLLVRRWRMEQELAADQLAALWMHSARAYGRALASLALRTQSEAKMPSPVLTAEQVCIVRRVTMLKQGSLKPASYRWRWTAMLTAVTVVSLMPLSGLRGTQTEQPDETAGVQVESDDGTPSLSEEERERLMEFQRTQEVYPPVQIEGRLKWNPGKLLTKDVSPTARYLQELATFALIEQFPEKAEIQCPATTVLRWTDMAREHGRVDIGAKCNESQGLNPKLITRLITSPLLGNYSLSSHVKTIEGLEARGLVAKKWDANFEKFGYETEPSSWLVEDGESYFYGSEAEVAKQIRNRQGKTEESPLIDLPDELKQQYENSAGALVYSNCAEWKQQLRKHMDGSPKAYEFAMVYPFLDNLEYIGVFVTGDNGLTIEAFVGYKSAEAATRGAKMIKGLIDMAKAQLTRAEDREFLDLLNEIQISAKLDSVRVELCSPALAELACKHLLPQKYEGWTDILAQVTPHKDPGTVQFECDHPFATTGFLAQSVKAEQYQSKRIRVSAELGSTNSIQQRSGVILWASDSQQNSLANATSGDSIGKLLDPAQALEELKSKPNEEATQWQSAVVELDIPSRADVLSFGVYTAAGKVMVRNVMFEVIGDAESSDPTLSLTALPRNMIQVPNAGYVCEHPTNLDFGRKTPSFQSTEAVPARTAEVEVNRTNR